jgi:hypothetical protein
MSLHARYDQDICLWVDRVSNLIRERRFDELDQDDLEHLVDEVQDVGKSESRELQSRMAVLLSHLLKWQYQPERRPLSISGKSWIRTIKNQRKDILLRLKETPSLKTKLHDQEWIAYVWFSSVVLAENETELDCFPDHMPWTFDQVLDPEFLPD